MTTEEIIKIAAEPTLIASAKTCYEVLAELNSILSELRLDVNELELRADLHLNELLKNGKGVELQKSNWKVSDIYREWKTKAGQLSDVRAIRRNLERHSELLSSQERFGQSYKNKAYLA